MIAISCQYNDSFAPVADLTVPIMQEYCDRHGYHLLLNKNRAIKRSIVWDRYDIILENLKDYDWICHMDADVLVTNMHIRLEEFTTNGDIVIARALTEQGKLRFNDGVALFKNSPWCDATLSRVWETLDDDFVKCGQDALEHWFFQGWLSNVYFERHKALNSFLYTEYGMPETTSGHWTLGDFVLHMPGLATERRVELIHQTLPKIIR